MERRAERLRRLRTRDGSRTDSGVGNGLPVAANGLTSELATRLACRYERSLASGRLVGLHPEVLGRRPLRRPTRSTCAVVGVVVRPTRTSFDLPTMPVRCSQRSHQECHSTTRLTQNWIRKFSQTDVLLADNVLCSLGVFSELRKTFSLKLLTNAD